ncbi:ATP-dependent 6-phosphofructokinase 3-like [Typha angustifolia]|uniref:ATP-dependent 6-phosphofructokinase 3-like n=1 Tax=Typha angustifolia TaxID=59011 RepID=UPI003C2ACA7B
MASSAQDDLAVQDYDSPRSRYLDSPRSRHLDEVPIPSASCFKVSLPPRELTLRPRSQSDIEIEDEADVKIVKGEFGYVLEDVPHLTDYIPDLPTYPNPLQDNPAYSVVTQYFVDIDDTVPQKVVSQKDSPRGTHFRRAGPRQRVYFESDDVQPCIVTCGGLCPGLNTVIRELVCGLSHMYGVNKVIGIEGGYRGFYARNTLSLTPKSVNDIHKKGGTVIGTSRGGYDTSKIVDNIQDRGINQVYIIGGDGTQKGASVIFKEIRRRGLKVSVVGIPKTIDNDIAVIDKSFGFDTAVEEAQRAINAAHVEAESVENGIGLVKLMGRYSGFIAMYATLASRDVDCCLIPESKFYLEGKGGLLEYIEKRLKENGHMVLVVAEGAGQKLIEESMQSMNDKDASGNKLLLDVGIWLSQNIKTYFTTRKMVINLKYIDPTYMIRAIPSNASDNVYCTLLAHSAIHGAMAGYTGITVGVVNGRHTYIPFHRVTETRNKVVITDRMWARLLSSTNQPSFLSSKDIEEARVSEMKPTGSPTRANSTDAEKAQQTKLRNEPEEANNDPGIISSSQPATPNAIEPTPAPAHMDIQFDPNQSLQGSESDTQSDEHPKEKQNRERGIEKLDGVRRHPSFRAYANLMQTRSWSDLQSTPSSSPGSRFSRRDKQAQAQAQDQGPAQDHGQGQGRAVAGRDRGKEAAAQNPWK